MKLFDIVDIINKEEKVAIFCKKRLIKGISHLDISKTLYSGEWKEIRKNLKYEDLNCEIEKLESVIDGLSEEYSRINITLKKVLVE